ncbi:hypothetical protein N9M86_01565 [Euryarchaeota archaeon]|nr:hypothetical protein [Euryarchaeota archaeon]MDA8689758.1 hypothetical protein [Euryarchaeota archaeon]
MKPVFFVALAHTDTVAYLNSDIIPKRTRVSNLNLFPNSLKENLLFSMSFDSKIHYDSWASDLDLTFSSNELNKETALPKRMFADCGAFQFRESPKPLFGGVELDFNVAWEYYEKNHVNAKHRWDEILLCSPDHIITPDMNDDDANNRFNFIKKNAAPFLEKCKSDSRIFAVGVIHGRNIDERKKQYEIFKSLGYEYVALGGMVPYSTKQNQVLDIVAGIKDIENPIIESDSILGRCRKDGIKLHVFGLNSPEWVRWWHRLRIDSFDGSKLSTEGAANGWYYIPNDGKGAGREMPSKPKKVGEMYQRIAVKKMEIKSDNWHKKPKLGHSLWDIKYRGELNISPYHELLVCGKNVIVNGVQTQCSCPACQYLKSSRCTSERCWFRKKDPDNHHVADPRMMGSTEHNMGRVAHNAFVFAWLIEQIERLNKLADESEITEQNTWLLNWKTIEVIP